MHGHAVELLQYYSNVFVFAWILKVEMNPRNSNTRDVPGMHVGDALNVVPHDDNDGKLNASERERGGAGQGNDPGKTSLLDASLPKLPTLKMPKGGGAIQGIGEKYTVNLANGTGSLAVPIATSSGRSGIQPGLTLVYDSGSGNSEFGLGWKLKGCDSITRKTSKGLPKYDDSASSPDSDIFIFSGAEDLVPLFKKDATGNYILDENGEPQLDQITIGEFMVKRYAPRVIENHLRIEKWTHHANNSDVHWRVTGTDNVVTLFGSSNTSRIYDTNATGAESKRIFSWLVDEAWDPQGNSILFNYKREDFTNVSAAYACETNRLGTGQASNLYLKSVQYGNTIPNRNLENWQAFSPRQLDNANWRFSLVLDYGEHNQDSPLPSDSGKWLCRADPFSYYHAGYDIRTYRLCRRVLMFHHFEELGNLPTLVSSTDLSYEEGPSVTYLRAVTQAGYKASQSIPTLIRQSLPPVEFEYSRFPSDSDLLATSLEDVDQKSLENLPVGLNGAGYRWLDLDGEGISGILAVENQTWLYKRNLGASSDDVGSTGVGTDDRASRKPKFGELETLLNTPSISQSTRSLQFGDVSGNGALDVISHDPEYAGYFERDSDSAGWKEFRPFRYCTNGVPSDGSIKFADLTGDGHVDILVMEDQVYTWYESAGSDGYNAAKSIVQPIDENDGPVCVYADSEHSIYLADMSGDGLIDVVRIENGACCYWPNLGYGSFGKQIRFDNSPVFDSDDQFDQTKIHIADVDGSGTSDILYCRGDGVDIFCNQSGNSFSSAKRILCPNQNQYTTLDTVDLLGMGTTCLVWSYNFASYGRPSMRYLDPCHGVKPHLLTKCTNNIGAETRINYASSTKFYLNDKQTHNPWITKLPFPVHCVESIESADRISGNRFKTHYHYKHGFYDGIEREFRGFARVDQVESTTFSAADGILHTNSNPSWDIPPIRTATWFHTGALMDRQGISQLLSHEYFKVQDTSTSSELCSILEETTMPTECREGTQLREATRSMKGKVLRTETYALDGSSKENIPYSVQQTNFSVVAIQERQNRHLHGVYRVNDRETLSVNFERSLDSPRVSHNLALEVDSYGNMRKLVNIAYGRAGALGGLEPRIQDKQRRHLMTYLEHDYTNALTEEAYRVPLPCEARQYELTGLEPNRSGARFSLAEFVDDDFHKLLSIPVSPYEAIPIPGQRQRRLLRRERVQYRRDNLSELCPVGVIEPMALPGRQLELAFSPGLLRTLYQRQTGNQSVSLLPNIRETLGGIGEGGAGYVDVDGDGHWWSTTGHISYAVSPTSDAPLELSEARRAFFMPQSFLDPFGNPSYTTYDRYKIVPTGTVDAVGNATSATIDYRVLQPSIMVDMNGNQTATAYDALGMSVATAVMGKPSDNVGDNVEIENLHLSQADLEVFFSDPSLENCARLLGTATTRFFYDLWCTTRTGGPVYSAVIGREQHVNDPTPAPQRQLQVGFTYSDGYGRIIQSKSRSKPSTDPPEGPWIGSGWTVFNNKGKPVQQFEPFFDTTHKYQDTKIVGSSSTLFYDPLGRVVAKLRPDHALTKINFDNWSETTYDVNDNILLSDPRTDLDIGPFFQLLPENEYLPSWYDARISGALGREEQESAEKASLHNNTPTKSFFDPLGRPVLIVSDNVNENIAASIDLDIQGNAIANRDPLGRVTLLAKYDMCSRRIHTASLDAGEAWILHDCLHSALMKWNSRNFRFRYASDALRRVSRVWLTDGNANEILIQDTDYGEKAPDASIMNLRGTPWRVRDQAGVAILEAADFKGNILRNTRQLNVNYKETLDLSQSIALEDEIFQITSTYDALSRPVLTTSPDGTMTYLMYDESGSVDRAYVMVKDKDDPSSVPTSWTPMLLGSQFNANGQVTMMKYGNGVTMYRSYDPLLYRLRQIRTVRQTGETIQDVHYTFDAVGNITSTKDNAQQTVFFRNTIVDPSNKYTYDAIYRLKTATGREHLGQAPRQAVPPGASDGTHSGYSHPGDGNAMGLYMELYSYDKVGNILEMQHVSSDPQTPGWTRSYSYTQPSGLEAGVFGNRLSSTTVGTTTEVYRYDGNSGITGNMTSMTSLPIMTWDFAEQLRATAKQVVHDGVPETTYYVYDSQGSRIRKVTESQSGPNSNGEPKRIKQRLYLGGYEQFRKYTPSGEDVAIERTTIHIGDDNGRIADIERRTVGTDDGIALQLRFQLSNLLGTACIELDDTGQILSYEEYFPYGSTSYQAVTSQTDVAKRYRYTGKELDTENGLYFFGARYYAAWIGRWTSCDPVAGPRNNYDFVSCNPIHLTDPDGRQGGPASKKGGTSFASESGVIIHDILTYVLRGRLALMGVPSVGPLETKIGGSKNDPFDLKQTGKTGRLDIAPLALQWKGDFEANIYEFKPESQTPRDAQTYSRSSETQLYAKYYPMGVTATGQNVTSAKVGTMLETLSAIKPSLLDPVKFSTPAVDIEIKMSLPVDKSKGNKKIAGLVVYSLSAKVKNKKGNEKQQILEALKDYRDQLRQQGIPPVQNPNPPIWVPLAGDGQQPGKPGDKPGDQPKQEPPKEEPKIEWRPPANDNAEPEKELTPEEIAAMVGLGLLLIIIIILTRGKGIPRPVPGAVPVAGLVPSSASAASGDGFAALRRDIAMGSAAASVLTVGPFQFGAVGLSRAGAEGAKAAGVQVRW